LTGDAAGFAIYVRAPLAALRAVGAPVYYRAVRLGLTLEVHLEPRLPVKVDSF
jgi:hypothetical protein